eukprot:330935_1
MSDSDVHPPDNEKLSLGLVGTLKDKPNDEDIRYASTEEEILKYKGASLTERSEILTWYLFEWANSPMFNVLIALVFPLFLSGLATHYGCDHLSDNGCDYEYNLIASDESLVVYIGGWAVGPPSFTFTIIAISGVLQLVSYISVGALADYGNYQYYLFRITAWTSSLMTIAYVFLTRPHDYLFAGFWVAIQLVFTGLTIIFYNAYLPHMVENHWFVRRAIRNEKHCNEIVGIKQQLTDDISQYSYAIGYVGALIMTVVAVLVFIFMSQTSYVQFNGFGLTASDNIDIQSFDEQWLKPVHRIDMSFDDKYLTKIQLFYHDIKIDGVIYGDDTVETTHSFEITDEYITKIEFWYNDDDDSINSLRFTTKNGGISEIYGSASLSNDAAASEIMSADGDDFIFAGYKVYLDIGETTRITGMDTIMLNEETGQFASTWPSRVVCLLVFLWWNIFQFLSFRYMKRRDGPPLPEDNNNPWLFSVRIFSRTLKQATLYPNLFRYLICWFLFSDGLSTMATTAVLFSSTELNFTASENSFLLLEIMILAAVGGVLFLWIQRKLAWNPKQMLLLHLCFYIAMPLYISIGLIPNIPFGLVVKGEMFFFCFVYGINFGSTYSYARSVFANMVPRGKEAEMFALFEITDKGSSWIGPLLTAIIANTLPIRWALIYVAAFFIIPMPILVYGVDLEEGMKQAGRWEDPEENDGTADVGDKHANTDANKQTQMAHLEEQVQLAVAIDDVGDKHANTDANKQTQMAHLEEQVQLAVAIDDVGSDEDYLVAAANPQYTSNDDSI